MSDDDERVFPAVGTYVRSIGYGRAVSDDEDDVVPVAVYPTALDVAIYPPAQAVSETLTASADDTALRHDTEMLSTYEYGQPVDDEDDDAVGLLYLGAYDPQEAQDPQDAPHAESPHTESISSSDFSTVARRTRDGQDDDPVGRADSVLMTAGTSGDAEEDNGW